MSDGLRAKLRAAQSDAAVAAVLMKNRGMTTAEAVAEVIRLVEEPDSLRAALSPREERP